MSPAGRPLVLYAKSAVRVALRGGGPFRERLGPLDERLVFVLGSPRSGTTFLGGALGSLPGVVDLGEVQAWKAAVPRLALQPPEAAAREARRILDATRRLGLVGRRRAVEQTPESAFVAGALARAYPQARFVHLVRDGRDAVCSLLERGWLSPERNGADDAGIPFGPDPRFWVEHDRRADFAAASDARRAAWAWRRYVEAGRASPPERALELRYERLTAEPAAAATELAAFLDLPEAPLAQALGDAHAASVGRFRRDLTPEQLADVEEEAGALLAELGYERVSARPG